MLGGSSIHLILHLKHDRDEFSTVIRRLTENEVPFAACPCIVIFLKIRIRKGGHPDRIELVLAVLLEALSHHLGRLACLEVLESLYLLIAKSQLTSVLLHKLLLCQLALSLLHFKIAAELSDLSILVRDLLILFLNSPGDSQFLLSIALLDLSLKFIELLCEISAEPVNLSVLISLYALYFSVALSLKALYLIVLFSSDFLCLALLLGFQKFDLFLSVSKL